MARILGEKAASAEATAQALGRAGLAHGPLGRSGLMVSRIGFGGYRVGPSEPDQRQALEAALLAGVNLIDTSANYADGGSEMLVGQTLAELGQRGRPRREQVVIVSKGGYLQGFNLALSQRRRQQGRPFPELLDLGPNLEHCIHPEFLADQIGRGLERLGVARIDVYLLHNPEYYLGWATQKQGLELDQARAEFYRRLKAAMMHLEREAKAGRIGWHGLSSNTMGHHPADPEFVSLSQVCALAEELGPEHRFLAAQTPLNLLEPGAAVNVNQPGGQTFLGLAHAQGLAVLINRPLNAMTPDGHLVRLAQGPAVAAPPPGAIVDGLAELAALEAQGQELLAPLAQAGRLPAEALAALPAAEGLGRHWDSFSGLEQWAAIRDGYLRPRQEFVRQAVARAAGDAPAVGRWLERLGQSATALHQAIDALYQAMAAKQAQRIAKDFGERFGPWVAADGGLAQTALRAARAAKGVSCVLLGMRRPAYVDDALAELRRPLPQADAADLWRALAERPLWP